MRELYKFLLSLGENMRRHLVYVPFVFNCVVDVNSVKVGVKL